MFQVHLRQKPILQNDTQQKIAKFNLAFLLQFSLSANRNLKLKCMKSKLSGKCACHPKSGKCWFQFWNWIGQARQARRARQLTNPCHYFQRVSHAQPLCKSHGQPYGDDGAHGGAGRPQKGQGRHLRVSQQPLVLLLLLLPHSPPPLIQTSPL